MLTKTTKLIQTRVPIEVHRRLRIEANESGTTVATLLRQLLIRRYREERNGQA